jgi:hypothetical protein
VAASIQPSRKRQDLRPFSLISRGLAVLSIRKAAGLLPVENENENENEHFIAPSITSHPISPSVTPLLPTHILALREPHFRLSRNLPHPSLAILFHSRPSQNLRMEAPLSSPSLHGPSKSNQPSYFSSSSSTATQSSLSGPTSAPQTQQAQQPAPVQRPVDTTSPFLRDFNLVAEAAKRAQMAVLMRDLEAVGI